MTLHGMPVVPVIQRVKRHAQMQRSVNSRGYRFRRRCGHVARNPADAAGAATAASVLTWRRQRQRRNPPPPALLTASLVTASISSLQCARGRKAMSCTAGGGSERCDSARASTP